MKILGVLFYLFALAIFYYNSVSLSGNSIFTFYDHYSIVFVIAGFLLAFINFRFREIKDAVKNALSSESVNNDFLISNKNTIQSIWQYVLYSCISLAVSGFIMALVQASTNKIGPFLALVLLAPLYAFVLKLFFFMPVQTSLEHKILLNKMQGKL